MPLIHCDCDGDARALLASAFLCSRIRLVLILILPREGRSNIQKSKIIIMHKPHYDVTCCMLSKTACNKCSNHARTLTRTLSGGVHVPRCQLVVVRLRRNERRTMFVKGFRMTPTRVSATLTVARDDSPSRCIECCTTVEHRCV